MFYAEISKQLKEDATYVYQLILRDPLYKQVEEDANLAELSPYLVGFIGVHVDYPVSEFQRGIDERKWFLTRITMKSWFFEGEEDGEVDRVLMVPAGTPVRFMFRDFTPPTDEATPVEKPSGKSKVAAKESTTTEAVEVQAPKSESYFPGSYREGGE